MNADRVEPSDAAGSNDPGVNSGLGSLGALSAKAEEKIRVHPRSSAALI
jgi:hypothetical protein